MVNTKNKKTRVKSVVAKSSRHQKSLRTQASSAKLHSARTRLSKRAHFSEHDSKVFRIIRRTIIGVILLAMLAVILALLTSIFTNPESLVTHRIESITADYYENYFYPRIEAYGTTDKSLSEILSSYTDTGFSKVTLYQLLLFDSERYASSAALLTDYCDPESTYVKIYPTAPFTKSDYRVDYYYACNF